LKFGLHFSLVRTSLAKAMDTPPVLFKGEVYFNISFSLSATYGRLFVYNNIGFREIKMIIPVYDSSEEEIGSSTGVPGPSTMKPSISSSSGMPYIIPEISVKLADVDFLKGVDVDFWLMLGFIFAGLWLGFRALEIMKGNYFYLRICFRRVLRCM